MKKKLAALVLAATMVMASGLTVFAAEAAVEDMTTAGSGTEVTGTSTLQLPTIDITVPTSADIVINPFKMEYKASEEEGALAGNSQIICATQQITNASNVAVDVNVTELCATPSEGISISATDVAGGKVTTKSAFLYLEVAEAGKLSTAYAKTNANQLVIPAEPTDAKGKKASKDAVVTLAAGDKEATVADFTIGGSVVANPVITTKNDGVTTTEAAPWSEGDNITIKFKFTFTPKVAADAK